MNNGNFILTIFYFFADMIIEPIEMAVDFMHRKWGVMPVQRRSLKRLRSHLKLQLFS